MRKSGIAVAHSETPRHVATEAKAAGVSEHCDAAGDAGGGDAGGGDAGGGARGGGDAQAKALKGKVRCSQR